MPSLDSAALTNFSLLSTKLVLQLLYFCTVTYAGFLPLVSPLVPSQFPASACFIGFSRPFPGGLLLPTQLVRYGFRATWRRIISG